MYHAVQGSPRSGIPPLVNSWAPIRSIQAIERALYSLVHAVAGWREHRSAVRHLQSLDDRMLQDVGIERREISEIVSRRAAGWR